MSKICFEGFGFCYAGSSEKRATLQDINLTIDSGQCVLLTGCSGSGKSTLIKAMNGLVPNFYDGEIEGHLYLDGEDISTIPDKYLYRQIATVYQNPRSQFFTNKIGSELVFSAENFALDVKTIDHLLSQNLIHFQLIGRENERLDHLSSGEKQRVACASASLMQPAIILLDEPCANLDTNATNMLAKAIAHWKQQGMTVIVAEHRSAYLKDLVDRQLHLENGRIVEIEPTPFCSGQVVSNHVVKAIKPNMASHGVSPTEHWLFTPRTRLFSTFAKDVATHSIAKSSIVAVIGENGTGKSSLFRQLCGLDKGPLQLADKQELLKGRDLRRRCFFVDQEVNRQLLCDSVLEEVLLNMPCSDEPLAMSILKELDLGHLKDSHPLSISGGQKQRVILAAAVAANREFTVLDEPTSGLDSSNVARVIKQIGKLRDGGSTVIVISHDPEFLLACSDVAIHIHNRRIDQIYNLNDIGKERLLRFMQFGVVREASFRRIGEVDY
ncbi:ABC transporter ATP-binding protein [Aliivibrio kagoshimensis]|uniref:ABC transporter ATP-binding protein n=1 Tax=Aliivibrio kagoshimensis TaxID=2910230 RepID=UPI003D0E1D29